MLTPHRALSGKVVRSLVFLIILTAALSRLGPLHTKSLWLDEITQVSVAQLGIPLFFWQLAFYSGVPLGYLVQMLLLGLGLSEYALRFHAAWFGILTVPLLYVTGRTLSRSATTGLIAAALLALFPLHIQYSQEARPYALFCFLELIAFYCAWRGITENNRLAWWGYALATIGAFNTHYFAALFVVPVALLVAGRAVQLRATPRLALTLIARFLAGVVVAIFTWTLMPWLGIAWISGQRVLGLAPAPDWPAPSLASLPATLYGLRAQLLLTGRFGWLMGGLLLLGLVRLARRQPAAAAFSATWFIVPPLVAAIAFMQRGIPLEPRFVLPILPVYLILVAEGGTAVADAAQMIFPRFRRVEPALALAVTIVLLFFIGARTRAYYAWPKESWREAVRLVVRYAGADDAILVPHMEEVLGIYAPSIQHTLWEPKMLPEIQNVARQRGRLWLVWSPYNEMGAQNADAVLDWLREDGAAEFVGKNGIRVFFWQSGLSPGEMQGIAASLSAPSPLRLVNR
ncbi:MAG: glycosyltransferase family 39 protein [Anaerolineae bacterium]|nr:glycosyltransferase family 39 protein [Anaerolineae bacterium]